MINVPITFYNAFEIYRQIICPESIISMAMGFHAYGLHMESHKESIIIESNLPHIQNNYIVCNPYGLEILSLPDVAPEGILTRYLLWTNNSLSKLKMSYASRGIQPDAESLEKILNSEVDFFEMAQYLVIKMPFHKDRRVRLEKNDGKYSALIVGNSLKEVAAMEIKLFSIISQPICGIK